MIQRSNLVKEQLTVPLVEQAKDLWPKKDLLELLEPLVSRRALPVELKDLRLVEQQRPASRKARQEQQDLRQVCRNLNSTSNKRSYNECRH